MVPAAADRRGHYQREDPGLMPALLQHMGSRACHTAHAQHQTEITGLANTAGSAGVLAAKPQQQTEVLTPGRAMLRHHTELDTCTRTYHVVEA